MDSSCLDQLKMDEARGSFARGAERYSPRNDVDIQALAPASQGRSAPLWQHSPLCPLTSLRQEQQHHHEPASLDRGDMD